jgi:tRNA-Thr(GGU) m(6)t(6)A37 methyltransferase TsaA
MESLQFIGTVHTPLKQIGDCPLQESEGAPAGIIRIHEKYLQAISGLTRGSKVILITWLHQSDRNTLTTKPRNNPNAKTMGVFATRSPDRPNPIGLHEAEILSISPNGEIIVSNLEVLDGTPLIDIKPVLGMSKDQ